jgi:uncharacterized protein (TIGR02147 family)
MRLKLEIDNLLKAPDYRGFLHLIYKINKEADSQFSYAYVAKQCGFSSKSFLKEVIDSKKSLSRQSCEKIIKGLKLPRMIGEYFFYLTAKDVKFTELSNIEINKELLRLKAKLMKQDMTSYVEPDIFRALSWPYVYAALGSTDIGATLLDVENRTNLSSSKIQEAISVLLEKKLIYKKTSRYFAKSATAFLDNIGNSDHFKLYFLNSLVEQYQRAKRHFNSKDELFFTMALSVQTKDMPKFKEELQELLDKYTSKIEDPSGDKVISLTCGMHYS